MTWWTRISTLLLAMLVMVAVGVFLGFLWTGEEFLAGNADLLRLSAHLESTENGRLIATGVAALVLLIALSAVLASWSQRRHLISVRSVEGGESVLVPTEAMAHHVADAALAAEHVESARASVTPDGAGSVAIALDLRIDEDAEAGAVVSAVDRRVASALEARYGIRMSRKPNVEVRHVSRRHPRGRGASEASDRAAAAPGAPPDRSDAR
ncbi:MAG: hypothetical protein AB7G21_04000 [Dehalococcoidia bacterium]